MPQLENVRWKELQLDLSLGQQLSVYEKGPHCARVTQHLKYLYILFYAPNQGQNFTRPSGLISAPLVRDVGNNLDYFRNK